jgi:hypothetical protein
MSVTALTVDGVNATFRVRASLQYAGNREITTEIWTLDENDGLTSGTGKTVAITMSEEVGSRISSVCAIYTGANNGVGPNTGNATGTSTTPSVSLTSTASDSLVAGGFSHWLDDGTFTPGTGDTERADFVDAGFPFYRAWFGDTPGTEASVTLSASSDESDSAQWAFAAIEVLANAGVGVNASQSAYRWRNDDGNEAAATWRRTENTADIIQINKNVRLRVQVNATGDPTAALYRLEFRRNGGAWGVLASPAALSASPHIIASGENTTAQLTAPATKTTADFTAGRIQDDENPADSIDIPTDDYTELEWCIQFTQGGEYEFRITIGGTLLDSYPQIPASTVFDGASARLKIYWKMEEGSAATTFVEEIIGLDGTLETGDVSQVTGKVGFAQRHDGNSAVRIDTADHADYHQELAKGFCVSLWFRTNTNVDNGFQPLFNVVKADDSTWVYMVGYWNWEGTDQNLLWDLRDDNGNSIGQQWSSGGHGDDQWHFAVFVLSPALASIWVDGQLNNSNTHPLDTDITGDGVELLGRFLQRFTADTVAFDGDIDEVAIWEGVLTEEQIIQLYNSDNGIDYRNIFGHPGLRKTPRPLSVSLPIRQLQL